MNALTLQKLWRRSRGRVPHMTPRQYEQAIALSLFHQPNEPRFWGLVDVLGKVKDRTAIYCFNFGNLTVKFPWEAEAVGFGKRVPLTITGSGTIRFRHTFRTLLHQVDAAFLVFILDNASHAEEHVQNGCLIVDRGQGQLVKERTVVLLPGSGPAPSDGVLYYHLMKRLTFTAEELEPAESPIDHSQLTRLRLSLHEGMILEPGWTLLLLEKDRYMWAVAIE
jgi:hypothetical protein